MQCVVCFFDRFSMQGRWGMPPSTICAVVVVLYASMLSAARGAECVVSSPDCLSVRGLDAGMQPREGGGG